MKGAGIDVFSRMGDISSKKQVGSDHFGLVDWVGQRVDGLSAGILGASFSEEMRRDQPGKACPHG